VAGFTTDEETEHWWELGTDTYEAKVIRDAASSDCPQLYVDECGETSSRNGAEKGNRLTNIKESAGQCKVDVGSSVNAPERICQRVPEKSRRPTNIAPISIQPIIRLRRDSGERELTMMRWSLIPFWVKDLKGRPSHNQCQGRDPGHQSGYDHDTLRLLAILHRALRIRRVSLTSLPARGWRSKRNIERLPEYYQKILVPLD
jgi:hypothetical protein